MAALGFLAVGSACDKDCVLANGVACDAPSPVYDVVLTNVPSGTEALVIAVDANGQSFDLALSGGFALQRAMPTSEDEVQWRAVLLGSISSGKIGTVTMEQGSTAEPRVTIVEAARGRADGYAPVSPGTIQIAVQKID
jgi:hypothetical protein